MMAIEFLAPDEAEFIEAIDFYNKQGERLGYEFAAEVRRTNKRIIRHPDAWTRFSKQTR
jgi:galactose-1-phosphate uridylyltransferase